MGSSTENCLRLRLLVHRAFLDDVFHNNGTELNFSTTYPQTNEQIERINGMLK